MTDYTYPSVFFAYLFFALMFLLAVFFFVKSLRDGYWGEKGEEAKYRMLQDEDETMKRRNP
jgi:hypothetical protein